MKAGQGSPSTVGQRCICTSTSSDSAADGAISGAVGVPPVTEGWTPIC